MSPIIGKWPPLDEPDFARKPRLLEVIWRADFDLETPYVDPHERVAAGVEAWLLDPANIRRAAAAVSSDHGAGELLAAGIAALLGVRL